MTRQQAADRLQRLATLRDAKEACLLGSEALLNQRLYVVLSFVGGVLVGVLIGA